MRGQIVKNAWVLWAWLLTVTAFPATAHAVLVWDWFFIEPIQTVTPTESPISFDATIFNSFFSDEHLTDSRIGGAGWFRGSIPNTYDFEFGPPGSTPVDFFAQFTGMDLAPGDSFNFVFGTFTQVGGPAPVGTYPDSIGGIGLRVPGSELFDSKQHTFGLNVVSEPSPVIPEPSSFFLFTAGFLGLAGVRRRRGTSSPAIRLRRMLSVGRLIVLLPSTHTTP